MEPAPPAAPGGAGQLPSSSSSSSVPIPPPPQPPQQHPPPPLSRYESQKRRDWNTFLQYLHNHSPPLDLARCEEAHVVEFLKYQDQFGKTKVHAAGCALFGQPNPTAPCACPLRQAWGSLDALIGRLRAAYEESGGRQGANPFAARAVGIYLREVREEQARARGMPFKKKKKKRKRSPVGESSGGSAAAGAGSSAAAGAGSSSGPAGSTSSVTEAKQGGPPPYS